MARASSVINEKDAAGVGILRQWSTRSKKPSKGGIACMTCLVALLVWISFSHLNDTDPQSFYRVLSLPVGVPRRITPDQAIAAAVQQEAVLNAQLVARCPYPNRLPKWEDKEFQQWTENIKTKLTLFDADSAPCWDLRKMLVHTSEAGKILGNATSKKEYDFPKSKERDHYKVLGVERDASVQEMRESYQTKKSELTERLESLGCKESTEADTAGPPAEEQCECSVAVEALGVLTEAATVLGDPKLVALYKGDTDDGKSALRFVSDPLQLVHESGGNPFLLLAPFVLIIGVFYYIREVEGRKAKQRIEESARHAKND